MTVTSGEFRVVHVAGLIAGLIFNPNLQKKVNVMMSSKPSVTGQEKRYKPIMTFTQSSHQIIEISIKEPGRFYDFYCTAP